MKLKRFLSLIILLIMLIMIPNIVNAQTEENSETSTSLTWTDTSKLEASIKTDTYKLNVTGITELSGHSYYVFFTNSNIEPTIVLDKQDNVSNYDVLGLTDIYISKYLERNGDIYLWICEQQTTEDFKHERKFIVSAKKIERPKQINLGLRIYLGLTDEHSNIRMNEPHDENNERKVKLKIGEVTDTSILLSLKNGEANSLNKLLSYAKTANSIYNGTLPVGKSESIVKNINLKDKGYYYIYSVLDDESETYYPLEDVSFVQASVNNYGTALLTDIYWDGFQAETPKPSTNEGNTKEPPKADETTVKDTKLPQTGESIIITTCLAVLIVLGTILYFKNRKYRDIK